MMNEQHTTLNVNGFAVSASFAIADVHTLFLPFLQSLNELHQQKKERIVAFIAAPPGTGKSTLVAFFHDLSKQIPAMAAVQAIGMDGFHYPQAYLSSHSLNGICLKGIKGAPETFDIEHLLSSVKQIKQADCHWPIYDRNLHDVSSEYIDVTAPIVILEGNYLLLDEPRWRELSDYADMTVFIDADPAMLEQRLIDRKMRGGASYEEASRFYHASDAKNIQRVLENHLPADHIWRQRADHTYIGSSCND